MVLRRIESFSSATGRVVSSISLARRGWPGSEAAMTYQYLLGNEYVEEPFFKGEKITLKLLESSFFFENILKNY
jgi:hypothetical protein